VSEPTRWVTDTASDHSQAHVAQVCELAAQGRDLGGEARLLDALVAPGSPLLDAGSGSGRTGAVVHARGHLVVGVHAGPVWWRPLPRTAQDRPGSSTTWRPWASGCTASGARRWRGLGRERHGARGARHRRGGPAADRARRRGRPRAGP